MKNKRKKEKPNERILGTYVCVCVCVRAYVYLYSFINKINKKQKRRKKKEYCVLVNIQKTGVTITKQDLCFNDMKRKEKINVKNI